MSSSSPPRRLNPLPPFAHARVDLKTKFFAILQSVDTAATLVCNEIDNALEPEREGPEHEVRQALKVLRKGVENLKSDVIVYDVLLRDLDRRLTRRYVMGLRSQSQ